MDPFTMIFAVLAIDYKEGDSVINFLCFYVCKV